MEPLERLFSNLDRWRHFPDYQLERRADIFFSLYLPMALEALAGVPLAGPIIPEFPLRKGALWGEDTLGGNQSVKVDYALFAADRSRVFFVELKTDDTSRRDAQDRYLERAAELGFRPLVEGIRRIAMATQAHQKYHHLLEALEQQGCLRLPPGLAEHTFPQPQRGLSRLLHAVEVTAAPGEWAIDVVYVQPNLPPGARGVDFATLADLIATHPDPLSQSFAAHLRGWTTPSGAKRP